MKTYGTRRLPLTVLLAAVLAAAHLLYGCHEKESAQKTLRFNIGTEPPSLDWSIATDNASIRVLWNLMEGLTRFNQELELVPGLAKEWESHEGGRRYVFRLREDARWTDGRPVLAQDFVYSWRRLLDPDTAGEYAYFLYVVKNAKAVNSGEIKDLSAIGVRAGGPRTLEVELERPVVFFPMITTFISTFPMREDVVQRWGHRWTEPGHIITCGPFKLIEWRHEYRITVARNPDYHGKSPPLDKAVFYMVGEDSTALSLFQTGALDAIEPMPPPSIPAYQNSPQYVNHPFFATYYYGMNVQKPPLDDPGVRKALAMAIDRGELPGILKGGQVPNPSLIPIGVKMADPELGLGFDPEAAKKLLAEAGHPGGKDLPPITISYNTQESHKMIAEFIQQQWAENLGIEVRLRNMEWKVYLKRLQTDPPQVYRMGWILDYPDPDAIMTLFLSDSGNNHTNWGSEEYDRLVREAATEKDPDKRKELYDRAQHILCRRDAAVIPLYTYAINMLVKPRVKDFPLNGLNILDLRDTDIIEEGP